MPRLLRIAFVVVGLAAAGAALGALAAGGALAASYMLRGLWEPYFYGDAVTAAWIGGTLGLVLGPACALTFLRRLPLWLALVGPTAATFAGGVLGEFWGLGLLTAPFAFFLAVGLLHRHANGASQGETGEGGPRGGRHLPAGRGRGSTRSRTSPEEVAS